MSEFPYRHLGLRDWPFSVVPSIATSQVWVGRPEVRRRLRVLARSASRVPASQLVLLWAGYGAGKTHTLRHLEGIARQQLDLVTLYVVTPRGIRSFLDIHRAVVDAAIAAGALASAGRDLFDMTRGNVTSNVERAVIRIGMYASEEARIAAAFLRADSSVTMRELKLIGINSRLSSAAEAIDALNDLIRILRHGSSRTVMLLVDEVQELGDLGRRRSEAVGGLHKVFDRHPQGLTMVLSFTTASQAIMRAIIDEPLADRAAEVITLPALSTHDAVAFVTDLVRQWSIEPELAPAPFEPKAVEAVVDALCRRLPELTPRALIRAFDRVLRDAELDIADQLITRIDATYALDHLPQEPDDAPG